MEHIHREKLIVVKFLWNVKVPKSLPVDSFASHIDSVLILTPVHF